MKKRNGPRRCTGVTMKGGIHSITDTRVADVMNSPSNKTGNMNEEEKEIILAKSVRVSFEHYNTHYYMCGHTQIYPYIQHILTVIIVCPT